MTSGAPVVLGAVLAGGESRRMGRDKAAADVGDRSMLERALDALATAESITEVVVVSSRPETPTGSWTVIPDARPPCGPLGGIESALGHAEQVGADAVFVLACDLPLVGGVLVDEIVAGLGGARASAAARVGRPDFEPLCAVYRTDCLTVVRAQLDGGRHAAAALFDAVDGVRVGIDRARLINVNTPDDLHRLREGLAPT